ncbi:hypothetical protein AnigIFM59636_002187 [Aspergillus niger]|nr:hypothetical protein AnigIFM59636_002187 [Aspergillus niger]
MLNVTVGLDEQGPGAMPLILEQKQSRKLVRDLGSDLEQLGQLNIFQVASVGYGLEKAGFVDCFELKEAGQEPSVSPVNCTIAAAQPILSPPSAPCLPISNPKSSISADPILADVVNSWMNDTHDNSHFLNGEAKQLLWNLVTHRDHFHTWNKWDNSLLFDTLYYGFWLLTWGETRRC